MTKDKKKYVSLKRQRHKQATGNWKLEEGTLILQLGRQRQEPTVVAALRQLGPTGRVAW